MVKRNSPEAFVLKLLKALQDEHGDRRMFWASVSDVAKRMKTDDYDAVDAAITYAESKGWLSTGGKPAFSVLLTAAGRAKVHGKIGK